MKAKKIITIACALMMLLYTAVSCQAADKQSADAAKAPKLALKIDRPDKAQLPRNFRMGTDAFSGMTKTGVLPSRQGMQELNVSASSAFAAQEFAAILAKVPVKPQQFYDIDLRGESHGYLDGTAVSWFAADNWGNDGRSLSIVEGIEKEQLSKAQAASPIKVYGFDDDKNILSGSQEISVKRAYTEEELVKSRGAHYFRLALSDHFRPDDGDVDAFLTFYKQLPADAWLHYHCFAGMGRTTIFMVMHDILKNADQVSFDDIIQRQALIGIVDLSVIPDKKKGWGRKAYIERYQFVKHFYDYVKANPQLKLSWSAWAKRHGYETYQPDYSGYIWQLQADPALPAGFRTSLSPLQAPAARYHLDNAYAAAVTGLDRLQASGSAQFSAQGLQAAIKAIRERTAGPIYVVDLRQETHGFFDDVPVSWYGRRNWGNIGKTAEEICRQEKKSLAGAEGRQVIASRVAASSDMPSQPTAVLVKKAVTEEKLVHEAGLRYERIMATDHRWPAPEAVDKFVAFSQGLPADAWLYFHDQAGAGRTTLFMAMYDMMRNPGTALKDILYRQHELGGTYLGYHIDEIKKGDWEADYINETARNIAAFYDYVQQNHKTGYAMPWSKWLQQQ